ncbi:hypothetical protein [Hydrogenovibrio halophilus]|uniref:hypothetical protein n=1 Tax=Hydrogenovibrio halophilus TaxID=373391 RepID=UPI0003810752|nr:hypothetical protein [Hydrogenovibrio halophilus]
MLYHTLPAQSADPFEKAMTDHGWELVGKDGGQSNFIGWAYIIHWQKDLDGKSGEVKLNFEDNMGEQSAWLEMSPAAKPEVMRILDRLETD